MTLSTKPSTGVVLAVEHGAAHLGGLLAKAVHAAFALLVAGGVPGQVVVDDGGEQVLQVDALRQAVGGHQDAGLGALALFHAFDLGSALFRAEFAGDHVHQHLGEVFF